MSRRLIQLLLIGLVSTLIVWLPFLLQIKLPLWGIDFSGGLPLLFANYDGPNYLIIAKSWYEHDLIRFSFSNPLPLEYYPAHLPLYPALIAVADIFLPGPVAMLAVTLLGTLAATAMFYHFARALKIKQAYFLTLLFLFLPARWLAVRSVGSPEPWLAFFLLAGLYYYRAQKFWLVALFGVLAQWTKSPAILFFAGLGLHQRYLIYRRQTSLLKAVKTAWPLLLIPLSVIPLFGFYQLQTGDFWAYFNSGDNFHLFLPPFSIFSPQGQFWVGEFWLEDVIYIWLIFGVGVLRLWSKRLYPEAFFAGLFYLSTLFVAHRDIARYILPIAPLVLIAFAQEITRPEFKKIFYLLLIPIFLYSWNFILNNVSPVADWTPYL